MGGDMKTCSACGITGDNSMFTLQGSYCKTCRNIYSAKWVKKNKEKRKKTQSDWYKKNKKIVNETATKYRLTHIKKTSLYQAEYRKKNKDSILRLSREKDKISMLELSDVYIKRRLVSKSGLSFKDIPQELVELKRAQLKLYRELRQK